MVALLCGKVKTDFQRLYPTWEKRKIQGTYFKICRTYFKISQTYFLPPENPFEKPAFGSGHIRTGVFRCMKQQGGSIDVVLFLSGKKMNAGHIMPGIRYMMLPFWLFVIRPR